MIFKYSCGLMHMHKTSSDPLLYNRLDISAYGLHFSNSNMASSIQDVVSKNPIIRIERVGSAHLGAFSIMKRIASQKSLSTPTSDSPKVMCDKWCGLQCVLLGFTATKKSNSKRTTNQRTMCPVAHGSFTK